jgi:hypothetical protein
LRLVGDQPNKVSITCTSEEAAVPPVDNLLPLHGHKKDLRAKSLAAIETDPVLSDHWTLVAEAMNAITAKQFIAEK